MKKIDIIDIKAEKICEFTNFMSWVNHASSWIGGYCERNDSIVIKKNSLKTA